MGTLFGVRLRVHLTFLFGGLILIATQLQQSEGWRGFLYGCGGWVLLFGIVLLHELGHCFGARWVGGQADEILMWPLGGLATTRPPHHWRAHLVTTVAGPAVNVVLLVGTGIVLTLAVGGVGAIPWNPFAPFQTALPIESELHYWLVLFFGLNLIILLFNLVPMFPLDGGRIVQSLLWRRWGFSRAASASAGTGMVGAIGLFMVGLLLDPWLICVAVFGYFTCWQQRQQLKSGVYPLENEFGYDFSGGYSSLETGAERPARRPSPWKRFRAARATARAAREAQRSQDRRRRVDEILEKVHRHGMQSLTPAERRMLEEETKRHRA